MKAEELKLEMIETAKIMYRRGMVNTYEGNISVRFEDRFFITPSQQSKETLTTEKIVELDASGTVLNPSKLYRPSSELKMHLAAYRLRRDVNAIVHNHSPFATAYALAGKSITSKASPEMVMIYGEIPLLKYGTPSTDAVHEEFEKYIYDYNVMLLGNHGLVSVGSNLIEAYSRAEGAENLAKTLLIVKLLGGEKELPEEELALLRKYGAAMKARAIEQQKD